MKPLIEVKNLKIDFKVGNQIKRAIHDIDFEIYENEILGIVGESGSGKSISILALLNLVAANGNIDGEIFYNGENILKKSAKELRKYRSKNFGMIFQEPSTSFDPIYTIGDTFKETLKECYPKLTKEEIKAKSIKALEEVYISNAEERLKNFPHQFSGGMLQRVMIALSLCTDPKILIADEPTTALDVTIQAQIIKLLLEIKKKRDITIIFVSHDLELVSSISDRTLVMYGGYILEHGNSKQLFIAPKSPYTYELLKSRAKMGQHYTTDKLWTIRGSISNNVQGCPFSDRCDFSIDLCKKEVPHFHKKNDQFFRCVLTGGVEDALE